MWMDEDFSVPNDATLFLMSAWHELFHGFTPDSFQPRLHNVASLIDELVDIANHWRSEPRNESHIKLIQDELKAGIRSEKDVLQRVPSYMSRCTFLANSKTPESIIAGGAILSELRPKYVEAFEGCAKAAIDRLPRGKGDALENIRRLGTFAFQKGKEDDDVLSPEIRSACCSHPDLFKQLVDITKRGEQKYSCTLSVIGKVGGIHSLVRKQGYETVSNRSLPAEYVDGFSISKNRILHVRLEVNGSSIRNAVALARKKLGLDLGFISLYTNPDQLRLHQVALVTCEGQDRIFVQSEQAFRRLRPRKRASRDIELAVELAREEKIDSRILAAIEQLSLASASPDSRTRFINLWSALETLAGACEGKTTLERVKQLLTPLIMSRHVHRRIRYLTILCQIFSRKIGKSDFGSGFKGPKISLDEMLAVVCSPRDNEKITGLLKFAKHPLLRFRIFQTWCRYHEPKRMKDTLEHSRQRLDWQIARIYRGRNLLVHEGIQVPFIVPLLDNLQNYLSMLSQRLIHELKKHPKWTIRDVAEYWNGRMQHQMLILAASPHLLTAADFLEDVDESVLWPES